MGCGISIPRMHKRAICNIVLASILLTVLEISGIEHNLAFAHFLGDETKDVGDGYQVLFLPFPQTPVAGSNDTRLNFSILKDGNNVNNVYVAFNVEDRQSGSIQEQFPFKWYEFSDITVPYTFAGTSYYALNVQFRMAPEQGSDSKLYTAEFDIRVKDRNELVPPEQIPFVIGVPIAIGAGIIGALIYRRNSKARKNKSSGRSEDPKDHRDRMGKKRFVALGEAACRGPSIISLGLRRNMS